MLAGCSVVLRAVACLVVVQTAAAIPTTKEPFRLEECISGDYAAITDVSELNIDTAKVSTDRRTVDYLSNIIGRDESDELLPQKVYDKYDPIITETSEDYSYVLVGYDYMKKIGSVAEARFLVYSVKYNKLIPIGYSKRLQLVSWGPKNRLVYVYKNNIYYLSHPAARPLKITNDGQPQVIYNGIIVDYGDVEDTHTVNAGGVVYWSPDGTRIAFEWNDASALSKRTISYHGSAKSEEEYPNAKPGGPIPKARLRVAILPSRNRRSVIIRKLLAPVSVVGKDRYIYSVVWVDDKNLMAQWTNRISSISQFVSYDTSKKLRQISGKKGLKLERKDGWVDWKLLIMGYRTPSTYLMIDWVRQGDVGSFPHVVKVTGTSRKPITYGEITVTDIYGWDDNYVVYFQATEKDQPSRRHVYAVEEGRSPLCLSCGVVTPEGNTCTRASAEFSDDFTRMILTCHGPDPPFLTFGHTGNMQANSLTLEDNSELREKLSRKQLPLRLDDWVDLGNGMHAQVRMWLPPGLDPEGSEKRPAVVEVYAAPDTQQIDDSFNVDIHNYFTTSRRYVYILIDGRGSGCKGDKMLFSVYRKLGTVEIQDQIYVTKRLAEKYPFIDSSHISVWGWSHGGFAAAMTMARDTQKVFRCGVAVAPVTDWRTESAHYIERYLGLPQYNKAGYINSAVTKLADHFSNNTFLLIHGTADNNVHFWQSMSLARALQKAGVLFRQQIYPDEDHSITNLGIHVYTTIDAFFSECFDEQS